MRALAAVDIFDPTHTALLDQAVNWSTRMNATLDLGYIDGMSYVRPAILDDQLRDILDVEMRRLAEIRQSQLAELVEGLPEKVRGVARYRYDHPAVEAFLSMCDGYDLVFVGTHGRTGLSRWLMGSFAERVVRESPAPVLVVRLPPVG
jgi:nucleotide-binding universal stress UspA family protein